MNIDDLHLKKKWDDIQKDVGMYAHFQEIYHNDYQNLKKWLEFYFKDLDMDDKCKLINYAGDNVVLNLGESVQPSEILALRIYSYALRTNLVEIRDMIYEMKEHYDQEINDMKTNFDGQIAWLQGAVDELRNEIIVLKGTR